MSHSELWDVECCWYSPNATWWICLHRLKNGLRTHAFMPTYPCLIAKFLATWAKFFEHLVIDLWSPLTFNQQMFLVASVVLWPSLNSQSISCWIRLCCPCCIYTFQIAHGVRQCVTWQYTITACVMWYPYHKLASIKILYIYIYIYIYI